MMQVCMGQYVDNELSIMIALLCFANQCLDVLSFLLTFRCQTEHCHYQALPSPIHFIVNIYKKIKACCVCTNFNSMLYKLCMSVRAHLPHIVLNSCQLPALLAASLCIFVLKHVYTYVCTYVCD